MSTLSKEGIKLFLNGMSSGNNSNKLRRFVWELFHTDYDEKLASVLEKCRESSQALAAEFKSELFPNKLEAAVDHTVKLIITKDKNKMKKKQVNKNAKFFVDVMRQSFETKDYQTAHLMLFALTHPVIQKIQPKMQKWAHEHIKQIHDELGGPTYKKHIRFWKTVRTDTPLPSLFAFHHYIQRSLWQGKSYEAQEAKDMIEIFQFLEHTTYLPIYNQQKITKFQIEQLANQIR
jgi:hypothetical protein